MSRTKTIHIHGGGDTIEVEVVKGGGHINAELVINVDQQETEASLTDSERRELIRALGGRL